MNKKIVLLGKLARCGIWTRMMGKLDLLLHRKVSMMTGVSYLVQKFQELIFEYLDNENFLR